MPNPTLANLVRVTTPTIGTVSTLSVGAAVPPWRDLDAAGIANGTPVRYGIIDGLRGSEICAGVYDSSAKTLTRVTIASSNAGNAPLDLSGAAQIEITASAEDFNKAVAFDNVVVNGGVIISQELGATGATLANNTAKYIADCWEAMYNHGAATAVVTSAQLAAASFPAALPGFSFAHQIKATTAIASPANGDFAKHRQKIEGYRIARWGWGAAGADTIVVSFNLYSTAAGTAFVKLSNSNQSRCFYHEISVAAGWNFYSFNVAGDTTGIWQATNSIGLTFEVFVAGKAASPASSLDAWGATNSTQTTNSTNLLGTNNNLTLLTGLHIAAGAQIMAASELARLLRTYETEFSLCCRYFWAINKNGLSSGIFAFGQAFSTTSAFFLFHCPVPLRAAPSGSLSAAGDFALLQAGAAQSAVTSLGGVQDSDIDATWMRLNIISAGGLVAGNASGFQGVNANARVYISARL